jgi:hypothetical protein
MRKRIDSERLVESCSVTGLMNRALGVLCLCKPFGMWRLMEAFVTLRASPGQCLPSVTDCRVKCRIISVRTLCSLMWCTLQLVEALCYKPEGRGFESRWSDRIFSVCLILSAALRPWGRLGLKQKVVPAIFLGGKGQPTHKADNLTVICEPIV